MCKWLLFIFLFWITGFSKVLKLLNLSKKQLFILQINILPYFNIIFNVSIKSKKTK